MYIDDLIIATKTDEEMEEVKQMLQSHEGYERALLLSRNKF